MDRRTFEADYFAANYRDYLAQNPPAKLAFYRSLIARHLPVAAPRTIHDIGCAFGLFLESLGDGWQRHGSDPSQDAIDAARRRLPAIRLRVARANEHARGAPFSVVTALDVLEHLPELEVAGDAIRDQLRDDGLFLFVVPVYDGLSGPLIARLDRDPTHLHKWPRQQWIEWALSRFEVVEWLGILRYLLPGGRYLHWPTRWLRGHTPAIAVVCRPRNRA